MEAHGFQEKHGRHLHGYSVRTVSRTLRRASSLVVATLLLLVVIPAGAFAVPPPDTTITGGSAGKVTPDVSFTFSASGEASSFECALDAGSYSACSSPKSYEGLAEGSHTFKVRAVGPGGADPTPAERTVEVREVTKAVSSVSVLDDFGREEVPLKGSKWTKTSWAKEIGGSWISPWHGYGANGSKLVGTFWSGATFSDSSDGLLVSATLGTGPISKVSSGEYLSLWLDMPSPGSARSGYEARFTGTNGTESGYKVELSKWVSGTHTVLGTKEGFTLSVGTTFVLTETGGSLTIWTGTTSFSRVLSAYDATYSSGYAGIEANKGEGTAYDFRAGNMVPPSKPSVTSVVPSSPANNNSPSLVGSAMAGSTVQLFTNSSCRKPGGERLRGSLRIDGDRCFGGRQLHHDLLRDGDQRGWLLSVLNYERHLRGGLERAGNADGELDEPL